MIPFTERDYEVELNAIFSRQSKALHDPKHKRLSFKSVRIIDRLRANASDGHHEEDHHFHRSVHATELTRFALVLLKLCNKQAGRLS